MTNEEAPNTAPYAYVDTEAGVKQLVKRVKKAHRVALDTEANSLYEYFQKVCLIQLSVGEENYIVDPLADVDLKPFLEVIEAKPLILHAGDYDLRMLRKTYGFEPKKEVFDTMLAAQLLGCEKLGLVNIAEIYLNVKLTKTGQKSNWSKRPLTDDQLVYAVDDTRYLEPLADALSTELEKAERKTWLVQSCKRMVQSTTSNNHTEEAERWRIRGAGLLTRQQMAYLRACWHWREREARKANRPPFKILGNQQLIELAKWAAKNPKKALSKGPKLPRHCTGKRYKALESAVEKVHDLPSKKWPKARLKKSNGNHQKAETEVLKRECAKVARDLGISPSVLAPQSALVDIARNQPASVAEIMDCSALTKWQATLLKPIVADTLKNES